MPELAVPKTMGFRELDSLLKKNGWSLLRVTGSHRMYQKDGRNERVALGGGSNEISGGGLKEIIRRFGLPYYVGDQSDSVEGTKMARAKRKVGVPSETHAAPGTFGYRLWQARTQAGISQGDLARKVGLSQSNLSAWERGAVNPIHRVFKSSAPAVYALASMFGFRDIMDNFAQYAPVSEPRKDLATVIEESVTELDQNELAKISDETMAKVLSAPTRVDTDIRLLLAILKPSDIMQWILDREQKMKALEAQIAKYEKSDYREWQRKAAAYDNIVADAEALLAKARKEIER